MSLFLEDNTKLKRAWENSFFNDIKGYLNYKMITSQNVSLEAQVRFVLFCRKVIFLSQDIQVFVFLIIPLFTKSVTS